MLSPCPDLGRWSAVVSSIAAVVDLDASARRHGALVRRRGVRSAADLLRLALLYGPGGLSLRATAGFATQAGVAAVCDVSLLERLCKAGDWLADILDQLLAHKRGRTPPGRSPGRLRLALVDGSLVSSPGSTGGDWRLHARYEPGRGGFTDLRVTPARTAETLRGLALGPGDVVVQDRGYAHTAELLHADAQGGAVIARIGWGSLKLYDATGARFDLLAALDRLAPPTAPEPEAAAPETAAPETAAPETAEHTVFIGTGKAGSPARIETRLILARKPPEAVEDQRRRLRRKASKSGKALDPRSLKAAGFLMLLTSVPADEACAEAIIDLYRLRWQIEMAFKRLKSLGGFDALRADDPRLVRSWLLAHLIAAVLIEDVLDETMRDEDRALPP